MGLESLVPDLERCKRLKEMGFPQDTAFFWGEGIEEYLLLPHEEWEGFREQWMYAFPKPVGKYAAPTFQEIWEALPDEVREENANALLVLSENMEGTYLRYEDVPYAWFVEMGYSSPVLCAADMWLWCAENGHLKGASDV